MNYDIRERAEIVSLAQQCSKELSAQPLIDYFESRRISDTPILSAVPSEEDTFEHISRFLTNTLSEREKVLIRVSLNFVKSELRRGIAHNARRLHAVMQRE